VIIPLLLLLPWALFGLYFLTWVRFPKPLPPTSEHLDHPPLVSVIVPARNEEVNIVTCLGSLAASRYPSFEIVIVDDQSEDRTGELARGIPRGNAETVQVVEGAPVPSGWLGKPWACQQGGDRARGDLMLFTDADTVHHPDLLSRAVAGMREAGTEVLTLVGRQTLGSFWEKLVLPRFMVILAARFAKRRKGNRVDRWQEALANGQFILLTRGAWEGVGGHEAVKGEVAEDLRLAQELVRAGHAVVFRAAEDALATRMYRSLRGLVAGWTKNVAIGGRQATRPWLRPVAIPLVFLTGLVLWIVPVVALIFSLAGVGGAGLRIWALAATGFGVLFWSAAAIRFKANPLYGLLYPLGAAVEGYIFLRSWIRGRKVEWKGRTYQVESATGAGGTDSLWNGRR
jgi:chlorobactene glucosyltransferase